METKEKEKNTSVSVDDTVRKCLCLNLKLLIFFIDTRQALGFYSEYQQLENDLVRNVKKVLKERLLGVWEEHMDLCMTGQTPTDDVI